MRAANEDEYARLASPNPSTINQFDTERWLDKIAIVVLALRQQPDAALTRATAAHLRAMVAQNRAFWQLVAQETDNQAEWIPNPRQQAAMGFELPPDTDVVWLPGRGSRLWSGAGAHSSRFCPTECHRLARFPPRKGNFVIT